MLPFSLLFLLFIHLSVCFLLSQSDRLPLTHYPPYDHWNPRWFYENNTLNYDHYDYSKDNLVILVSTPPYHVEVFAFAAYHLHKLGYEVHAWVGSPTKYYGSWIDFTFPFIKHVVYLPDLGIVHWYNRLWRARPSIPLSIKLLVYITGDINVDVYSLCQLQLHEQLYRRAQRVMMVSHQATLVQNASHYCQAPKCTLLHLGYHVQQTALSVHSSLPVEEKFPLHAAYAYPVFELPNETIPESNYTTTLKSFNTVRRVIIQGAANKTRRDYDELFRCIRKINHNPTHQYTIEVSIVGYLASNLKVPTEIKNKVILYDNIKYEEYYQLLLSHDFIATFVPPSFSGQNNGFGYISNRISSSIPAGVLAEVPIIATGELIDRYHCLNASKLHHQIAKGTNCRSLIAAMELSFEEYQQMKEEIQQCKALWLFEGQAMIKHIAEGNQLFTSMKSNQNKFEPKCPVYSQ